MHFSLKSFFLVTTLAVFAAALPLIGLSSPNEVKNDGVIIARVFTGWKDGASFKRISEYFNGQENTGGMIVLRTHADQRSGFYFLVRAVNPGAPTPVKVTIELITPTDTRPKSYVFSTELKNGTNILNLGLTANDWPDAKANPVAWKMEFVGADNHLLAREKSYLWEKPDAK